MSKRKFKIKLSKEENQDLEWSESSENKIENDISPEVEISPTPSFSGNKSKGHVVNGDTIANIQSESFAIKEQSDSPTSNEIVSACFNTSGNLPIEIQNAVPSNRVSMEVSRKKIKISMDKQLDKESKDKMSEYVTDRFENTESPSKPVRQSDVETQKQIEDRQTTPIDTKHKLSSEEPSKPNKLTPSQSSRNGNVITPSQKSEKVKSVRSKASENKQIPNSQNVDIKEKPRNEELKGNPLISLKVKEESELSSNSDAELVSQISKYSIPKNNILTKKRKSSLAIEEPTEYNQSVYKEEEEEEGDYESDESEDDDESSQSNITNIKRQMQSSSQFNAQTGLNVELLRKEVQQMLETLDNKYEQKTGEIIHLVQRITNDGQSENLKDLIDKEVIERKSEIESLRQRFDITLSGLEESLAEFGYVTKRFKREKSDMKLIKDTILESVNKIKQQNDNSDLAIENIVSHCIKITEILSLIHVLRKDQVIPTNTENGLSQFNIVKG